MYPLAAVLLALISISAIAAPTGSGLSADGRPLSTPTQRKRAVELATSLEDRPFDPNARAARAELMKYIIEAPDITVVQDLRMFGDPKALSGQEGELLLVQNMFSLAKYQLENSGSQPSDVKTQVAGVHGVLRAYESMKRERPKLRIDVMEQLLALQANGKLSEYVADVIEQTKNTPGAIRSKLRTK